MPTTQQLQPNHEGPTAPDEAYGWLTVATHRPHDVDLASSVRPWTLRVLDQPETEDDDAGREPPAVAGLPSTRRSIAGVYGGAVPDQSVVVTHGIEQAFGLAVDALVRRGDHVVVVTPARREAWRLPPRLGAEVTRVGRRPGHALDVAALARAVRPGTRAVLLDAAATAGDLDAILALARQNGLWLVADEEHLLDHERSVVSRYERGVSLGGLAAVQGLAGIGWVAFGAEGADLVLDAVADKAWSTGPNAPYLERRAASALDEARTHQAHERGRIAAAAGPLAAFAARNDAARVLRDDDAAPFAWLRLPSPSRPFAEHLLDAHRVLVLPGEAVDAPRTLRITLTGPTTELAEGLRRIRFALTEHA